MHELSRRRYAVAGTLVVTARSRLHDARTTWSAVTGSATLDPRDPAAAPALELAVDMARFDAGDPLRDLAVRRQLDLVHHPTARFTLAALEELRPDGDGFTARVRGDLAYNGRTVEVVAAGRGALTDEGLSARATFTLDVTRLGLRPPRVLFLKVDDTVSIDVIVRAP